MTPMQLWRFHQLQFNYIFQSKSEIKHINNLNKNKVMKNKRNNVSLNSDTNEVSHILGSEEWNWLDLENLGKSRDSHSTDQKWLKVDTTNASLPTKPSALTSTTIESLMSEFGPSMYMSPARNAEIKFPVIFDTGASLAISGCKQDFEFENIQPLPTPLSLGGMANGLEIQGTGIVNWTFTNANEKITIRTNAYYVKSALIRLISSQRLLDKNYGTTGKFVV